MHGELADKCLELSTASAERKTWFETLERTKFAKGSLNARKAVAYFSLGWCQESTWVVGWVFLVKLCKLQRNGAWQGYLVVSCRLVPTRFYLSATIREQEANTIHPCLLETCGSNYRFPDVKTMKIHKVNFAWAQRELIKSKNVKVIQKLHRLLRKKHQKKQNKKKN